MFRGMLWAHQLPLHLPDRHAPIGWTRKPAFSTFLRLASDIRAVLVPSPMSAKTETPSRLPSFL